ncbi:ABC transporter substrate-binding protein [Pseudonocardiaceae bacterium YIM PH 21723]|nr:ABC transporter substrate-binding protein [Pseudonocardiaceae bacterium YIM PH 21723]
MSVNRRALLGLGLLSLLSGCATGPGAGTVLRIAQPADPRTLDPHKISDMPSMNALINVFDTLTTRGPDNRLAPGLALSWEAPDPYTWRFRLRPGVRFHNGEACDAVAVAFSVNRLLNPATKSPIVELRNVSAAVPLDELTVELRTSKPDPIIPAKVSLFGGVVVPPGYLAVAGDAGFARHPVGTGPFTFVDFQRDRRLRLRANPGYWAGPAGYRDLEFMPMPNTSSALAALQSDEVDMVTELSPDSALQITGYRGVSIRNYPAVPTSYVSLDTTDGPLSDVRVRRALNHAVDVPLLIKAVMDGKARELATLIPRESFGHDPAITPYTRDLDLAKRLLTEAGYPNGFDTTLTARTDSALLAEAISGLLARAGVRAAVRLLDIGTYTARLTSDNRRALGPMYLAKSTGWTLDGQSLVQSNVRHDRRQSRWNSPEADRLIDAEELGIAPEDRQRAFTELQRLLKDQAPFVFLFQSDSIYAMGDRAHWQPNAAGVLRMHSATVTA